MDFIMHKETSLDGLFGYLGTFSSYRTYLKRIETSEITLEDPYENTISKLKEHNSSDSVTISWPVFLKLTKKE